MTTTQDLALSAALAMNRDEDVLPLDLRLPLTRQLDVPFCDEASKSLKSLASDWNVVRATQNLADSLPDEPGLYMFAFRCAFRIFFENGKDFQPLTVLYVGQTGGTASKESGGTIKSRYRGEYQKYVGGDPQCLWDAPKKGATRADDLARALTIHPLEFWYCTTWRTEELERHEKRLIHLLNPPLNRAKLPRLRPQAPIKAF